MDIHFLLTRGLSNPGNVSLHYPHPKARRWQHFTGVEGLVGRAFGRLSDDFLEEHIRDFTKEAEQ